MNSSVSETELSSMVARTELQNCMDHYEGQLKNAQSLAQDKESALQLLQADFTISTDNVIALENKIKELNTKLHKWPRFGNESGAEL